MSETTPQNWSNSTLYAWFIGVPSVMLFLTYAKPQYSGIWLVVCFLVLLHYTGFLFWRRRENFLLVAAVAINTVGPLLSQLLLRRHGIESDAHCDMLVGYAFHVSSFFVLSLFVLLNVKDIRVFRTCLVLLLVLLSNIAFSDLTSEFRHGPDLVAEFSAPPVSPLLIGRYFLTILAVYLSIAQTKEGTRVPASE